jgi:hypothetical protein
MRPGARPERAVAALTIALGLAGCPHFPDDLCDGAGCVATPDAGAADASSSSEGARDDDAAFAVHVSTSGEDAASGSAAAPVRTLARAFAIADARDAVVHVCAGRFDEAVRLEDVSRRVSVRGGFVCDGGVWVAAAGTTRFVAGTAQRFDVRALRLRDLEFEASADEGPSAITLELRTSTGASIERVSVTAGRGRDGQGAVPAAAIATPGLDGAASGDEVRLACGAGASSTGGRGGKGNMGSFAAQGGAGARSPETEPTSNGGERGDNVFERACGAGARGADGPPTEPGDEHDDTLDPASFAAARGRDGRDGVPGQGGGGGGTTPTYGDAPSGGSGGCGGAAGLGGEGGGSSIGVVLRAGALALAGTRIVTGEGGRGGAGARGGDGARGGAGVVPTSGGLLGPCASAAGGRGSGGSGGGGGHGGASIAILTLSRDAVSVDGAPVTGDLASGAFASVGPSGAGGVGGVGGSGATGPSAAGRDGKKGLRQALRPVTER